MRFEKGQSGNLKGRPPKKRVDVFAILQDVEITHADGSVTRGFDPIRGLAVLAATAKSEKVKCEACAELASYIAPKLKAIEHSTEDGKPLTIKFDFGDGK